MPYRRGYLFALLPFLAAPTISLAADVSPGLWETTAEVTMPGHQGGASIPPITQTRCFRSTDVQDAQQLIPKDAACQLTTSQMNGNRLSWGMQCQGGMNGTGEVTFTSTRYEGVFRTTGPGTQMTMNYSGRRIGDCE